MATKYILVGGYPYKAEDGGKAFAEVLMADFEEPVKILDCLFARPVENWSKAFAEDQYFFAHHLPDKKLEFRLADPDKFMEQVRLAHAVYIRGGETDTLIGLLNKNTGWQKELDGKTLAGSSAGADAIARYYYDLDDLELKAGMGLLPVKVLVHYRSDYNAPNVSWDKAYSELKDYKENLPILALKEGQFEVRLG